MNAGLPERARAVVDRDGASVLAASRPGEQDSVLLCLQRYWLETACTSRDDTAVLDTPKPSSNAL